MPLQATSGAASYDAFGGNGVAVVPQYIEDVFSTFLYTGTGATQSINNGIDLSTKGGLIWLKCRSNAFNNYLSDTTRGITNYLSSNTTGVQNFAATVTDMIASTSTTGFVLGSGATLNGTNNSGQTHVSWSFAKAPKFFDIVTYTGTGSARTVAHSLGSTPGCFIVKRTDTTADWIVYHRSVGATAELTLNLTDAAYTNSAYFNNTSPTSTNFTVGTNPAVNANGGTYVAYLFAHDAGGFGLTGTDNVISCGSVTLDGSGNATVNLGYEPQWVMIKNSQAIEDWLIADNMRGMPVGSADKYLRANSAAAETSYDYIDPTSTGFNIKGLNSSQTYIYIAVRRGPMKVPTTGTSVFGMSARSGTGADATVTGSAGVSDAVLIKNRGSAVASLFSSRLTGTGYFVTSTPAAEVAAGTTILQANPWDVMDGVKVGTTSTITNASANTYINYLFDRAPSFMDVVCYSGTGSYPFTINHNLGVVPELIIFRVRNGNDDWYTYAKPITSPNSNWYQNFVRLNQTAASGSDLTSFTSTPTSTSIPVADYYAASATTYAVYLFATCPGVSKVGSYTGNGTTQAIACGFTGGARFVLIKATSTTGNWLTFDTARGMTTLTDPVLSLNSTAAETATLGACTTTTGGFTVNEAILAGVNTNGVSFVFLAIA